MMRNSGYASYVSEGGQWQFAEAPRVGEKTERKITANFSDVWWYYANLIDYVRIVMALAAIVIIMLVKNAHDDTFWSCTIATLLFGDTLLDWIDGPVARHYKQSTIIGAGMDWLADILTQYGLAVWCLHADVPPHISIFVVLFTAVEMSCGLFDFAVSATGVYPSLSPEQAANRSLFFSVERLYLSPELRYTDFGTLGWLVNTMYPIAFCLRAPAWVTALMAFPAYTYAWHECCQLVMILANWQECVARRTQGLDVVRMCTKAEQDLLINGKCQIKGKFPAPPGDGVQNIYWENLFVDGVIYKEKFPLQMEIHAWVRRLVDDQYGKDRFIVSYGYITAPANGDINQQWHYDYAPDVSNLFVPLSKLTTRNTMQFVRGARKTRMDSTNYFPAVEDETFLAAEGLDSFEVCQQVAPPFAILKLSPSVMHRGIANKENYDRILFFVSTAAHEMRIGESAVYKADDEDPLIIKRGNLSLPPKTPSCVEELAASAAKKGKTSVKAAVKSNKNK